MFTFDDIMNNFASVPDNWKLFAASCLLQHHTTQAFTVLNAALQKPLKDLIDFICLLYSNPFDSHETFIKKTVQIVQTSMQEFYDINVLK